MFYFRHRVWRRRAAMRRCSLRCFAVWAAGSTWESSTVTSWPITSCSWSSSKSWWESYFTGLLLAWQVYRNSLFLFTQWPEVSVVCKCIISTVKHGWIYQSYLMFHFVSTAEGWNLNQPTRGGVRLRLLGSLCHRKRRHQHGVSAAALPGRPDAGDGVSHGCGPRRPW